MAVKSIYFDSAGLSCQYVSRDWSNRILGREREMEGRNFSVVSPRKIVKRRCIHRQTRELIIAIESKSATEGEKRERSEIAPGNGKADREIIKLPFRREGDLSVYRVPIRGFDNRCEYHRDVAPFRFVFANSRHFSSFTNGYCFEQEFKDSNLLKQIEYFCFLPMSLYYKIKRQRFFVIS